MAKLAIDNDAGGEKLLITEWWNGGLTKKNEGSTQSIWR